MSICACKDGVSVCEYMCVCEYAGVTLHQRGLCVVVSHFQSYSLVPDDCWRAVKL